MKLGVIALFAVMSCCHGTTSFAQVFGARNAPAELDLSDGIPLREETRRAWEGIRDAAEAGPWRETADAVLTREFETRWHRYLRHALRLPDWLDLGLENRTRFESFDHPWRKGESGTDAQVPQRSRLRVGLNGGPFRVLFEGQDSRTHMNDQGDFANDTVINEMDILQLFLSATARNVGGSGLRADLHFGRMTLDFGRRRLIARNDFRNTTNAFDGVHLNVGREEVWRVRAFLVEPVQRFLRTLDEQTARSLFWGVFYESDHVTRLRANLYYFGLNDQTSSPSEHRTYDTFGLRLYKAARPGEVDYESETAWQTGSKGTRDHFAYMQHAELGYTFGEIVWTPRVAVQYDYASGTRSPNGSQDQTFDRLFGARNFELMPTGIYGPFTRSNISSPGWRVIFRPRTSVRLQLKHRIWYLAQGRDAFVGSGLQDATGGSGNYLGQDVQVRLQWDPSPNLAFDVGYDHWFKGTYFDRLPASAGLPAGGAKDSDYFYALTKLRF